MSSSHPRTLSMSSWAGAVLMFVLPMMTCVPATASPIEHCLRLKLNPPPPPPPPPAGYRPTLDFGLIACRDEFRVVGYYLRSNGKLPLSYLEALCNIFGNDQQKVEHFVSDAYLTYDFQRLVAGRSCAAIQKNKHLPPPSS